MSEWPLVAATSEVASSGSEVPAARMVSPIRPSLQPRLRAMADALSTNQLPPRMRQPSPPRVMRMARHSGPDFFVAV